MGKIRCIHKYEDCSTIFYLLVWTNALDIVPSKSLVSQGTKLLADLDQNKLEQFVSAGQVYMQKNHLDASMQVLCSGIGSSEVVQQLEKCSSDALTEVADFFKNADVSETKFSVPTSSITKINALASSFDAKNSFSSAQAAAIELLADKDAKQILEQARVIATDDEKWASFLDRMKQICLNFLIQYLPTIKLDPVQIENAGSILTLSNIDLSGFNVSFENVHVSMNNFVQEGLRLDVTNLTCVMKNIAFGYEIPGLLETKGIAQCDAGDVIVLYCF